MDDVVREKLRTRRLLDRSELLDTTAIGQLTGLEELAPYRRLTAA